MREGIRDSGCSKIQTMIGIGEFERNDTEVGGNSEPSEEGVSMVVVPSIGRTKVQPRPNRCQSNDQSDFVKQDLAREIRDE
jgi:hypothetical protein